MSAATIQAIIATVSEVVRIPIEHIVMSPPYMEARHARMLVCSISNDVGSFDTRAISEALHGLPADIVRSEIEDAAALYDDSPKFRTAYKKCSVYAQTVVNKIRDADLLSDRDILLKPENNPYTLARQVQVARVGSEVSQDGLKALAAAYLKTRDELNQITALNHAPITCKLSALTKQEKIELSKAVQDVLAQPLGSAKGGAFRREFINAMARLKEAAQPLTNQ